MNQAQLSGITDNQIIIDYQKTNSSNKTGDNLGINHVLVLRTLWKNGIETSRIKPYKHSYNENYFSIPNIENSYWAGFISADGYVSKSGGLEIQLANKDRLHLEMFKKTISYSGAISSTKNECRIRIHSAKIVDDLYKNFNIITKKSLILKPPSLENSKLIESFIVGYIDGDGSIGYYKNGLSISIYGTSMMLNWIKQNFIDMEPSIVKNSIIPDRNIFQFRITGKKAETIMKKSKNIEVPKLERKWNFD